MKLSEINAALQLIARKSQEGFTAPEVTQSGLANLVEALSDLTGVPLCVAQSVVDTFDHSRDIEDEAQPEHRWPKQCPCCNRVLNAAGWQCLQFAGFCGVVRSGGKRYAVELRHCICASTIGIQVELPMARALTAGPLPAAVAESAQAAAVHVFKKREESEHEHVARCPLPFGHYGACGEWPF